MSGSGCQTRKLSAKSLTRQSTIAQSLASKAEPFGILQMNKLHFKKGFTLLLQEGLQSPNKGDQKIIGTML